jgi:hypothetical protein
VALVNVAAEGVPKLGVTNVGELLKTRSPLPVSSEIIPASSDDVVEENCAKDPPVTANVPDVGRVTVVGPLVFSVTAAPEVVKFPPRERVVAVPDVDVNVMSCPDTVRFFDIEREEFAVIAKVNTGDPVLVLVTVSWLEPPSFKTRLAEVDLSCPRA